MVPTMAFLRKEVEGKGEEENGRFQGSDNQAVCEMPSRLPLGSQSMPLPTTLAFDPTPS